MIKPSAELTFVILDLLKNSTAKAAVCCFYCSHHHVLVCTFSFALGPHLTRFPAASFARGLIVSYIPRIGCLKIRYSHHYPMDFICFKLWDEGGTQ